MRPSLEQTLRELAALVDEARAKLGPGYAVSIVARHKRSARAHIILGQNQPEAIVQTVAEAGADPGAETGFIDTKRGIRIGVETMQ